MEPSTSQASAAAVLRASVCEPSMDLGDGGHDCEKHDHEEVGKDHDTEHGAGEWTVGTPFRNEVRRRLRVTEQPW